MTQSQTSIFHHSCPVLFLMIKFFFSNQIVFLLEAADASDTSSSSSAGEVRVEVSDGKYFITSTYLSVRSSVTTEKC